MADRKLYIDKFPLTNLSMKEHVKVQFKKLIAVDKIRMHKLLFVAQYGLLYVMIGLLLGSVVDYAFPVYDPEKENTEIMKEIALQTVLIVITVFYARKLVKICPYLFNFDNSFSHSHAQKLSGFDGTIVLALVFVATQTSFLKKIQHISKNVIIKKLQNTGDDDDEDLTYNQNTKPIEVQSNQLEAVNPNQLGNNTAPSNKGINTALLHQGQGQQPTFDNMGYNQDSQNLGQMAMLSGTANNLNASNHQHQPYQASNNPNTQNMMNNFAEPTPLASNMGGGDGFGGNYSYLDNDYQNLHQAAYS
jgi:hypothetical protein